LGEGEVNLIDAVKSGRPFRRTSWGGTEDDPRWITIDSGRITYEWPPEPDKGDCTWFDLNGPDCLAWNHVDILADDWEIQEPEVRITRTQFFQAYNAALRDTETQFPTGTPYFYKQADFLFVRLAKRLGLGPE
jgi:hypothetical protein